MADTFDLRQFLAENKLTKNTQLLAEVSDTPGLSKEEMKLFDPEQVSWDNNDANDVVINYEGNSYILDGPSDKEIEYKEPGESAANGYIWMSTDKLPGAWFKFGAYFTYEGDGNYSLDEVDELEEIEVQPSMEEGLSETNAEVSDDVIQKKYNEMFGRNPSTTPADVAKALGVPEDRVGVVVAHTAVQGIKLNETTNKMTQRDKYLTRLVENALGLEGYSEPTQRPTYSEGDEIAQKEPLPKYENIDKLMQEIEHGTSKAMYEYKMKRMKEIADMLEEKATSLEEGEHAEYTDKKAINQMHKDIKKLRDGVAKLRKEFDKKFNKKAKPAAAEKEEKEEAPVTLAEGTFDLRKFLVENKITTNSRMLSEEINPTVEDIASEFNQAGITPDEPVTYIIDYGNPAGTDPAETTSVSKLIRQLIEEATEGVDVMFNTDITQGQGELLGDDLPQTEGLTCKLEVYFEDSKMYEIWQ